jgi:diguanylate cyclase (GGDEF)-like protein
MRLKIKFNLFLAVLLIAVTAVAWFLTANLVKAVDERWAYQFAQRQVQFDKHRTLMPLLREIALARQLAVEPAIIDMAKQEQDAAFWAKAIDVLERYRLNFRDRSYFFALLDSGHYYYNDADNHYSGNELRYKLSPENANDQWFYATVNSGKSYQVNLDPDVELGVTKVWINVLVEHEGKKLGMIGTGIDISQFLKETVDIGQEGIHNIFIDSDTAIQLYRDPSLIDYASITKPAQNRKQIDAILSNPSEVEALRNAMSRLKSAPYQIETMPVTFEDQSHLLGIAYLPEIGWYDLTLMDTKSIFHLPNFYMLPLSLTVVLLLAMLALGALLSRTVIKPIGALNAAALDMEHGEFTTAVNLTPDRKDEIGEVTQVFRHMSLSIEEYTLKLESMVAFRTAELEQITAELKQSNHDLDRLSRTDQLTQLSNRFDLMAHLDIEVSRSKRTRSPCAIIMLDIDNFKLVNDQYGHNAGDEVLKSVSSVLAGLLRVEDVLGRWGGEEFMLLLPGNTATEARQVAERIRLVIEQTRIQVQGIELAVTVSQGIAVFEPHLESEVSGNIKQADDALYQAKQQGRNRVVVFGS